MNHKIFHFHIGVILREALRIALISAIVAGAPVLADDLSNGSWSTTDASNSAIPPNGWPAGMQPSQVEPSARSNMGAVKRWWERSNPALSTTGSVGAYVITPSNVSYPTAYTQGEVYCAKANFTSVGADTLNVNSLGAKAIYQQSAGGPVAVIASAIRSGQQFCASYDSALNSGAGGFQLLSTVSVPGNLGAASASSLTASGTITSGAENTISGTQSFTNGQTLTLFNIANAGTGGGTAGIGYVVFIGVGGAASNYAIVGCSGGACALLASTANGSVSFSMSGNNFQMTNSNGGSNQATWVAQRISL